MSLDYRRYSAMLGLVALIWLVSLAGFFGLLPSGIPMLVPRRIDHLPGIFTMAFVHGNWGHLLANTLPFLVFSWLISLKGNRYYLVVTVSIMLLSGLLLWCFGRSAAHIGASSLVFGYFGYILMRAFYSPSMMSILVAVGVFFVYGGLIWGVLPINPGVSWDGHLFGLVAGAIVAKVFQVRQSRR